jgi:3-oxoacyl-[acyl-carrier protein] reductase
MQLNLQGKTAIVTGASKGIGAGIALALAAEGVNVAVNYATNSEAADRITEQIKSKGGKAISIRGNVGNPSDARRLFEETAAAFGPVSIVVNNAGIHTYGPMEAITEATFMSEYRTNVYGPFAMSQLASQFFPATGGSIINIGSAASRHPTSDYTLYASTKGAIDVLTKALARELAPRRIRVNVVAPGATATEGAYEAGILGGEKENILIQRTPLGRVGLPADIANVVTFLCSDAGAWITGERISASGGLDM